MRKRPRQDANHHQITAEFKRLGCSVLDLSAKGDGCPDILVAFAGRMRLVEIKDGAKPPSRTRLTPDQVAFWNSWKANPVIVRDLADVQRCMESIEDELDRLRRSHLNSIADTYNQNHDPA